MNYLCDDMHCADKLISIIVPVYNIKKYLENCIKSIINQTYSNIEIILVDDGSNDGSEFICDKYAKLDSRIIVIHKENGGLSDARNSALDIVKGDCLVFVDGDDAIHPQLCEILSGIISDYNVDIVAYKFIWGGVANQWIEYDIKDIEVEVLSGEDAFINLNRVLIMSCNKMYKREIFDRIRFPKDKLHEDEFLIHRILYEADRIAVIDEQLYYYTQDREGSITSKMSEKRIENALEAFEDRIEFVEKVGWNNAMPIAIKRYCDYCMEIYKLIYYEKNLQINDSYKEKLRDCARSVVNKYPNVKLNREIYLFVESPNGFLLWDGVSGFAKKIISFFLRGKRKIWKMVRLGN